jgi:hypothetical protein
MPRPLSLLLGAPVFCMAASVDHVDLRPRLTVGDQTTWTLESTSSRTAAFRGMTPEKNEVRLKLEWTTKAVEADDKQFTIACDVTDVSLVLGDGATTVEYDSRTMDKSKESPFAPALNHLLDAEISAVIDRDGTLVSLKGLGAANAAAPSRGVLRAALMEAISEGAWRTILTETCGAGGGKAEASVGDTWTIDTSRPLLLASHEPFGVVAVRCKRSLETFGSAVAKCGQTITVKGAMQSQGIRPDGAKVEQHDGKGTGRVEVDVKTGQLVRVESDWAVELGIKPDDAVEQTISMKETMIIQRGEKAAPEKKPADEEAPEQPPTRRFH